MQLLRLGGQPPRMSKSMSAADTHAGQHKMFCQAVLHERYPGGPMLGIDICLPVRSRTLMAEGVRFHLNGLHPFMIVSLQF